MMEFESIVDAQLRVMLEAIEQDLEQRRQVMLQEAQEQARSLLRDVRRQARARLGQAIAEERRRWDQSLQRATASLSSRIRRRQQILDREQLAEGREKLKAVLLQRWQDAGARRLWLAHLLREAKALLPGGQWLIECPQAVDVSEFGNELAYVPSDCAIEFTPAPAIEAGFVLRLGGTRLDMSATGLLGQSAEIDGELLAEIRSQQAQLEDPS